MAEQQRDGDSTNPGLTFTSGLIAGIVVTIVVALVGFLTVGDDLGIPVLVLGAICVAAAVVYRFVGTSGPEASSDPAGSSIPQLDADAGRPLGDTAEAHDELNPHDLPKESAVRHEAVEMAGDTEGTTRGKAEGGAAGAGGAEEGDQDAVSADEAHGGAQASGRD